MTRVRMTTLPIPQPIYEGLEFILQDVSERGDQAFVITVSSMLLHGMRTYLVQDGYDPSRVDDFINRLLHEKEVAPALLTGESQPTASQALARLDAERRIKQQEERKRELERQQLMYAASRRMQPIRQAILEIDATGFEVEVAGGRTEGHVPLRDVVRYEHSDTECRIDFGAYEYFIRVVRANAFATPATGNTHDGLHYYCFVSYQHRMVKNSELSTADEEEVIDWLVQGLAAREYNPPDVLGDAPLEHDADHSPRTRSIDLDT